MTEPRCVRGADGARVLEDTHLDDCPDRDACRGCQPCTRAHCQLCGTEHAATVCPECIGQVREDLHAIRSLSRLLHDHAANAGHDGALAAAAPIIGGNAMVLLGPAASYDQYTDRGIAIAAQGGTIAEQRHADDLDNDLEPVAYTLDAWEWMYRRRLNMELPRPMLPKPAAGWHPPYLKPNPARAYRFIDDHLDTFAHTVTNPSFENLATDLKQRRCHLEDELLAGDREARTALKCPKCGVYYVRLSDPKTPCTCEPIRIRGTGQTIQPHKQHGGRRDELECPRCHATIDMGEYVYLVGEDYRNNAAYLPAIHLTERTGAPESAIRGWAYAGHIKRQGKDAYDRQLYDVADTDHRAHLAGYCGCPKARPHAEHKRDRRCLQCHYDETCCLGPHETRKDLA